MISPTTANAAPGRLGHIIADHQALRHEADELLVLAEHAGELGPALRTTLVERLGRLCDQLYAHFALEEDGGYMSEALLRRPSLLARATRLQLQHQAMLTEGTALTRALLSMPPPRDARGRMIGLLESLRAHEQAEHALLHEAFVADLGSGD
jgi:hypothetical protein